MFTLLLIAEAAVGFVALPILLPMAFRLNGLLYSFPAADILTFIVAVHIIVRTYRELGADGAAYAREGA